MTNECGWTLQASTRRLSWLFRVSDLGRFRRGCQAIGLLLGGRPPPPNPLRTIFFGRVESVSVREREREERGREGGREGGNPADVLQLAEGGEEQEQREVGGDAGMPLCRARS